MASKLTASILTMIGGVFYIIGGVLVALLLGSFSSLSSSDLGLFGSSDSGLTGASFQGLEGVLIAFALLVGFVMIFGGFLINSESAGRRKVGGILVVIMIIVGGLTTLGGLLIGFILASIGAYMGFTYRSGASPRGMTFGLGPVGSFTLGPQGGPQSAGPAGSGPLNYCIKCGTPIREGAVFCGSCGARVVD